LARAQERHWGRRDNQATWAARNDVGAAGHSVGLVRGRVAAAAADVERERATVEARARALERWGEARATLRASAGEIARALDETRPARVLAAARGEPGGKVLAAALGPAPAEPSARAVWCGIATEVEAWRDRRGLDDT